MIKKEELHIGTLVWWTAERYTKEWSCPCVVTYVGEDDFRVMSLDDFKETELLRMNDGLDKSSRNEMEPCSLEKVRQYLKQEEREFKDAVTEAERELADAKEGLKTHQQKAKEFLAKQEKPQG